MNEEQQTVSQPLTKSSEARALLFYILGWLFGELIPSLWTLHGSLNHPVTNMLSTIVGVAFNALMVGGVLGAVILFAINKARIEANNFAAIFCLSLILNTPQTYIQLAGREPIIAQDAVFAYFMRSLLSAAFCSSVMRQKSQQSLD